MTTRCHSPSWRDSWSRPSRRPCAKLDPRHVWHSPVIFVVWVGSLAHHRRSPSATRRGSPGAITLWLWATVLFANFAEAVAEGRGKAQAATLRARPDDDDGAAPRGERALDEPSPPRT